MPIIGNFPVGGGGGNSGLQLASVTDVKTLSSSGKAYVKWTDPEDLVVAGSTLASWAGTILVRKAGSAPISRRDGVIILDSKIKNAYQGNYFCDSGLTDGVTYYYKLFPYSNTGTYTDNEDGAFVVTPNPVALGDVSDITLAAAGNGKLSIKWTDPAATVVSDGVTLATWASTVVVVKAGGYATLPNDPDAAFTYTSTTRNGHASNALIATGLTNETTYYVSLFPMSTDGAANTSAVNRETGVANRIVVSSTPSQDGSLTYDGNLQSPQFADYDEDKLILGGTISGINAGSYNATVTPKDDYMWPDGTMRGYDIPWSIGRAEGILTVTPDAITLDKDHLTESFTIGGNYDGEISITVDDATLASVEQNGSVVTVSNVDQNTGSTVIRVNCTSGVNYTECTEQAVALAANFIRVYGVQWDGTATTKLSRTDAAAGFVDPTPAVSIDDVGSSPFDDLYPWNGMVRVNDDIAGVLVAIPKFYYKWEKTGKILSLRIAEDKLDGFYVSPAHADRGDGKGEKDIVYVGRYHCSDYKYRSVTNAVPKYAFSRSTGRTTIRALGDGYHMWDWATVWTIRMLYLVEFADFDSQRVIGIGCAYGSPTGKTDKMIYHTGSIIDTNTQNKDTSFIQYRNIEGLWDSYSDYVDGCYNNVYKFYIEVNPDNFNDSGGSIEIECYKGWGAISEIFPTELNIYTIDGFQFLYPSFSREGSSSTYIPDKWQRDSGVISVGGWVSSNYLAGIFYNRSVANNTSNNWVSSRIMKFG